MHRRTMRVVVASLAVASLALTACASKSPAGPETTLTKPLTIKPVENIDAKGKTVAAGAATTPADPAGDGKATCAGVAVAMAGALTGPNAALGLNILYGAKVAIDKHNKANAGCQVELKQFDTEGTAQKATQVAPTIVNDTAVIAMLGPAFSGETKATGAIFNQAGLISVTSSATNPNLTKNGWTNFFRGLGNDLSQGEATANYLTSRLGFKKICVVQDDSEYGIGLADSVTKTLGSAANSSCASKVKTGDKDFSTTVNLIKAASPDAVYYSGYYAEGGPFASQLRSNGVTAVFVSGDGTNDAEFVKQAGQASNGAILTCPCGPPPAAFATDYKALNKVDPGVYSADAYDLMTIMVKAIDSGVRDRAGMIKYFKTYSGDGIAKTYKWDATGELTVANPWIYKVS